MGDTSGLLLLQKHPTLQHHVPISAQPHQGCPFFRLPLPSLPTSPHSSPPSEADPLSSRPPFPGLPLTPGCPAAPAPQAPPLLPPQPPMLLTRRRPASGSDFKMAANDNTTRAQQPLRLPGFVGGRPGCYTCAVSALGRPQTHVRLPLPGTATVTATVQGHCRDPAPVLPPSPHLSVSAGFQSQCQCPAPTGSAGGRVAPMHQYLHGAPCHAVGTHQGPLVGPLCRQLTH